MRSPSGATMAKSMMVWSLRVDLTEAIRHDARRTKGRDGIYRGRAVLETPRALHVDAAVAVREQRPVDEPVANAVEQQRVRGAVALRVVHVDDAVEVHRPVEAQGAAVHHEQAGLRRRVDLPVGVDRAVR